MKKVIFLGAFLAIGVGSAKNLDPVKEKKENKTEKSSTSEADDAKKMQCQQVGMLVWCTNEVVPDTMCWGEGSGTATYQQAVQDQIHNSQLLTEFYCGLGTGSGPGGN